MLHCFGFPGNKPLQVKTIESYRIIGNTHVPNPFRPGFTIVIFIHYKPRIAVAIPDL